MKLILGPLLFLLLASCTQQEQLWEKDDNQATVEFTLSLPTESKTRGNVSTYPKDPSQWTDAEKLADGRFFEYITVMILKGTTLQAYEDLDVTDKNAQATIQFDRTFTTGVYTLMAVANYNDLNDFTELLTGFKNGTKTYAELMAYKLQAGGDGIASKTTMQPLTLVQEIDLHPGLNEISGEMLRTYARIRIEVRNQSATNDLTVNGITFSNNFAQKEAYIWQGQGYLPDNRVAIDVDSEDALTPFSQPLTISKITSSDGTTTVNSSVVFDGYILESQETDDEVDYSYTLDVSYGIPSVLVSETPYTTTDAISSNYDSYNFLIQNTRSGKFMYDEDSNVLGRYIRQGSSLNELKGNIQANYLWKLIKKGNGYQIMNVASGDYIGQANNNSYVQLNSSNAATYTLSEYDKFLRIANNDNFLNDYGGTGQYICGYYYEYDAGSKFRFYPVLGDGQMGARFNGNIILKTINKETARVEAVREIKRNDFINALVTVSYNEDIGTFEFEVEDWSEGGGDITFS